MKISSVNLRCFKRFTNVCIQDLPESAKLVVLVGPNGSGKSSVFEAFNTYLVPTKGAWWFDSTYHVKVLPSPSATSSQSAPVGMLPIPKDAGELLRDCVSITFHSFGSLNAHSIISDTEKYAKLFYLRTAYRNESDFSVSSLQKNQRMVRDEGRPQSMISADTRVSGNYQRIVASAVAEIFNTESGIDPKASEVRDRLIGEIAESLSRVLPDLKLTGPGDPLSDGTFFFKKGDSEGWRYKNLSGGEKAAFDLLLDFIVKKQEFDNTIFGIDEPEGHMNSAVQGALLEELYNKTPDSCQLWIATHSIGMMRKAKELSEKYPGSVVFLDFADRNFDEYVEIKPADTDRAFWKRVFRVAIGDLVELVAPKQIVFCEGSRAGSRNAEFDAKCFRQIFAREFPDTEFVSMGGTTEIDKNAFLVTSVLGSVIGGIQFLKLIDRDDQSDLEVEELESKGYRVLVKRHLESYLYDDEILRKLCHCHRQPDKVDELLAAKVKALSDSQCRDNPPDDIKSAGGDIYNAARNLLKLTQCGSNAPEFCISTLAPLITSDTKTYQDLKKEIFGA